MIAQESPNINSQGVFLSLNGKDASLQTFYGRRVSVMNPKESEIDIEDIGYSLAKQCRFNGHCSEFYSVAEHCVRGSELAEQMYGRDVAREFLLHDATEAYLGDLIRPVKRMIPQFEDIEQGFWWVISKKFSLPYVHSKEVHYLDNVMVCWEKRDLLPNSEPWPNLPEISHLQLPKLHPWDWETSLREFTSRYLNLFAERSL